MGIRRTSARFLQQAIGCPRTSVRSLGASIGFLNQRVMDSSGNPPDSFGNPRECFGHPSNSLGNPWNAGAIHGMP
eukprot:1727258-Pyramimonas_sp.AAC.1